MTKIEDIASTYAEKKELATRLIMGFETTCKSDDVQKLWIATLMDILLKVMGSIVNGQPNIPEPSSADQE